MSRRSGLGRGLAALIPPAPNQEDDADAEGFRIIADPPTSSEDGTSPDRLDEPGTNAAPDGSGAATTSGAPLPADPAETASPPAPDVVPPAGTAEVSDAPDATEAPPPRPSATPAAAPDAGVTAATATLMDIAPDRIDPNPSQPRDVFDPDELEGLATSLKDIGVLQPLVVRPAAGDRYELIAGERRWRAAQLAGLDTVPVVVRHTDDANLLKEALVENIHRVQLNPLEEAAAYQQLLEEFGVTQEELATRLGRSRPSISNAIRLLQLPAAVQRRLAAGVLSAGHAKVLLAMDDAGAQTKLAERIIAEGLSVRATEELVRLQLIDGPARAPRARRAPTAPGLIELQEDLSDALEARVRITMGARKGRLAIEFASVDDLERIVGVIAGGISGPGSSPEAPSGEA